MRRGQSDLRACKSLVPILLTRPPNSPALILMASRSLSSFCHISRQRPRSQSVKASVLSLVARRTSQSLAVVRPKPPLVSVPFPLVDSSVLGPKTTVTEPKAVGYVAALQISSDGALQEASKPRPPWAYPLYKEPTVDVSLYKHPPPGVKSSRQKFDPPPPGSDKATLTPDRNAFRYCTRAKDARILMTAHFVACKTATDVLRVFALCMQRRFTASLIGRQTAWITGALFRSREHCTDARICSVIRIMVKRLLIAGLAPTSELFNCGTMFAARSRRLDYMRWFLVQHRRMGLKISNLLLRRIICKLSTNKSGFGSLRNGTWSKDDLRQILFGFENATGIERTADLRSLFDLSSGHEARAWLLILTTAGDRQEIWSRWLHYKEFQRDTANERGFNGLQMGSGDIVYIRAMHWTGDYEHALTAIRDAHAARSLSTYQLWKFLEESTDGDSACRKKGLGRDSDAASLIDAIATAWREEGVLDGESGG